MKLNNYVKTFPFAKTDSMESKKMLKRYGTKFCQGIAKTIIAIALLLLIAGCKAVSIRDADSVIYNRKSLFSSGKIEMQGLHRLDDKTKIETLKVYHSNGYFSLDIDAKGVVLTKDEMDEIIK